MSASRSRTPTPNLSIINSASLLDSTTSRPHTYDEITSIHHSREDESQAHNTLRPPIPHSSNPDPGTSTSHSIPRVRSAESSPEPPMAKRLHREIIDAHERPRPQSSPTSDSQDGGEDTGTDTKKREHRQHPSLSGTVLKKKRTRTLTTPHQAAVLHALLAQSRFPTTAVREEVGRSIGLSARKVQIWFQNQRQKARRPRSQGDIPTDRPPQYGPFPNVQESASLGAFPAYPEQGTSSGLGQIPRRGWEQSDTRTMQLSNVGHSIMGEPALIEPPPRLLGPGMPGAYLRSPPPQQSQLISSPSFDSCEDYRSYGSRTTHLADRTHSAGPSTSQPRSLLGRDPSRILPPLPSNRPSMGSASTIGPGRSITGMRRRSSVLSPLFSPRSSPPETRFAHHPPEQLLAPMASQYSLQPRPQWDRSPYPRTARPSSSTWSDHVFPRTPPPNASRRDDMSQRSDPMSYLPSHPSSPPSPPAQLRSGRYDPVRAIFIPYSTLSPPPMPSPGSSGLSHGQSTHEKEETRHSP